MDEFAVIFFVEIMGKSGDILSYPYLRISQRAFLIYDLFVFIASAGAGSLAFFSNGASRGSHVLP
jgi:hypothetical protein